MYLLDTNIISELRLLPKNRANANFVAWASQFPDDRIFYINSVVVMELERGVMLKQRKDPEQGNILANWLYNEILPSFSGRILNIDKAVAHVCSSLHVPNPKPENDAWIAATAIAHGMTLVTHNVKDFNGINVDIIDPFKFTPPSS